MSSGPTLEKPSPRSPVVRQHLQPCRDGVALQGVAVSCHPFCLSRASPGELHGRVGGRAPHAASSCQPGLGPLACHLMARANP